MFWRKIAILHAAPFALFLIDRVIKNFLFSNPEHVQDVFLSPLVSFTLYKNQGVAWSLPLPQTLTLILISGILLILVLFLIRAYREKNTLRIFLLTLVIVGAVSNLTDRLLYGFVIDYINILFSWWVFNLADVMITAGIVSLAIINWQKGR